MTSFRIPGQQPRIVSTALIAAATVTAPAVVLLSPAWASESRACDVYTNSPYDAGSLDIAGPGGRSGCISRVDVKTDLKYSRLGPDGVAAYRSGAVINVSWTAYGCAGNCDYYTKTTGGPGQESESSKRRLSC